MKTKENEMKALKWRLSEKPSVENVTKLLQEGILTKEEARQIILDEIDIDPVTLEDIQAEVKLLRKLVLDMSDRQPQTIIKIIEREVEKYPHKQPYWFTDYNTVYCTATNGSSGSLTLSGSTTTTAGNGITNAVYKTSN